MPLYVVLALGAALCFSLNGIWAKLTSNHAITDRNTLIFYFFLLSAPLVLLFPLFTPIQNPMPAWWLLSIFAMAFFIGYYCTLTVLFRYDISILQPFFHFQSIFSVGLAWLWLGETFPPLTYIWIGLIVGGGILVSLDEKMNPRGLLSKNFGLFLLGILSFAVSDIFAKQTLAHLDIYNLKFWSAPLLLAMATIVVSPRRHSLPSMAQLKPLGISVIFAFVATLLLFKAFASNITISQPLAMLGSLFTLLISIALSHFRPDLLEHHAAKIYALRTVGVAVMLAGAIILTLYS